MQQHSGKQIHGDAAAAIELAPSYREHAHRALRVGEYEGPEVAADEVAYWPTRRGSDSAGQRLEPLIVNCQRCGEAIAPVAGWWCEECDKVVWFLQQTRGMSMVQIAASGEYEPPMYEWIQDVAPWLIMARLETVMAAAREPRKLKLAHEGELKALDQQQQIRRAFRSTRRSA